MSRHLIITVPDSYDVDLHDVDSFVNAVRRACEHAVRTACEHGALTYTDITVHEAEVAKIRALYDLEDDEGVNRADEARTGVGDDLYDAFAGHVGIVGGA